MNESEWAKGIAGVVRDFVGRTMEPLAAQVRAMADRLKAVEDRPPAKDGDPGPPGKDAPAMDRAELRDLIVAELAPVIEARVATWALDFERHAQGVLQRAIERMPAPKNGEDGKDAIPLTGWKMVYDGRRTFHWELQLSDGEVITTDPVRMAVLLDAGAWKSDGAYEAGDCVTYGGSLWIAQKDAPEGRPESSPDWRLSVKRGRDGRDRP